MARATIEKNGVRTLGVIGAAAARGGLAVGVLQSMPPACDFFVVALTLLASPFCCFLWRLRFEADAYVFPPQGQLAISHVVDTAAAAVAIFRFFDGFDHTNN
jgi:hypothetical protein